MTEEKEKAVFDTSKHPAVIRLVELQGNESDSRFAARWLGISSTSWYRLRTGDYSADPSKLIERCESSLALLEDHHAQAAKRGDRGRVIQLDHVKSLMYAVRVAMAETRNRLAVLLAPTGGGKSTCVSALRERYGMRVVAVEATETWRESYLAATLAISQVCGITDAPASKRAAEQMLIEWLQAHPCVLVVDEAHYFGPVSFNLIKAILNLTQCTVVLLAIPELWARMKRSAWCESEQIRSRTIRTVMVSDLRTKDVEEFIQDRLPKAAQQLGGKWAVAVGVVHESARRFGYWDSVERICDFLREETEGGPVTLEMIRDAVKCVETMRK